MIGILAWVGTVAQIIGAVALASRRIRPIRCYEVMLLGSLLLMRVAEVRADWPQLILMTTFTLINGAGLFFWRKS